MVGAAAGLLRLIIVIQKIRHASTQQVAMRLTRRGAMRSRGASRGVGGDAWPLATTTATFEGSLRLIVSQPPR
jgi:hypothetical protein